MIEVTVRDARIRKPNARVGDVFRDKDGNDFRVIQEYARDDTPPESEIKDIPTGMDSTRSQMFRTDRAASPAIEVWMPQHEVELIGNPPLFGHWRVLVENPNRGAFKVLIVDGRYLEPDAKAAAVRHMFDTYRWRKSVAHTARWSE